jgi:hypothetical protein
MRSLVVTYSSHASSKPQTNITQNAPPPLGPISVSSSASYNIPVGASITATAAEAARLRLEAEITEKSILSIRDDVKQKLNEIIALEARFYQLRAELRKVEEVQSFLANRVAQTLQGQTPSDAKAFKLQLENDYDIPTKRTGVLAGIGYRYRTGPLAGNIIGDSRVLNFQQNQSDSSLALDIVRPPRDKKILPIRPDSSLSPSFKGPITEEWNGVPKIERQSSISSSTPSASTASSAVTVVPYQQDSTRPSSVSTDSTSETEIFAALRAPPPTPDRSTLNVNENGMPPVTPSPLRRLNKQGHLEAVSKALVPLSEDETEPQFGISLTSDALKSTPSEALSNARKKLPRSKHVGSGPNHDRLELSASAPVFEAMTLSPTQTVSSPKLEEIAWYDIPKWKPYAGKGELELQTTTPKSTASPGDFAQTRVVTDNLDIPLVRVSMSVSENRAHQISGAEESTKENVKLGEKEDIRVGTHTESSGSKGNDANKVEIKADDEHSSSEDDGWDGVGDLIKF